jgi:hypothetical protein
VTNHLWIPDKQLKNWTLKDNGFLSHSISSCPTQVKKEAEARHFVSSRLPVFHTLSIPPHIGGNKFYRHALLSAARIAELE